LLRKFVEARFMQKEKLKHLLGETKKNMKKTLISIPVIMLGLFFSGCKTSSYNSGSSESSLYGIEWYVKEIHIPEKNEKISAGKDTITGKRAFIEFDHEKESVHGNGGCNIFGGKLAVKNKSIGISQVFSTKMYCEGVQEKEDAFFSVLEKVNRFKIKGKKLFLYQDKSLLIELESE